MLSLFVKWSERFPRLAMRWKGARSLSLMYPKSDAMRYLAMAMALSTMITLIAVLVSWMLELEILMQSLAGLLAFAGSIAFFIFLPDMELRAMISEIETEMPFFLRSMGMMLDMGIPFQRAIALSCEGEGALAKEMRHVLHEVESGIGFQRALVGFAMTFDSEVIKRTVSQILSAYEVGGSGNEIRKIGDELLSLEQHRLKDFSARSSVFGLLFIMTSAVAPTFFLVFAIAGRFAMAERLEPIQITIALLVVFPVASVLLLMLSKATMPRAAFSREGGFDARMLIPGAIMVIGFAVFPEFQIAAMVLAVIASGYLVWTTFKTESRIEELERNLPDALFSVSGMPKSTKAERIFEMIEKGGYGPLSEEAGKTRAQIRMNVKLESVLEDLSTRNRSPMLKRAAIMMRQMIDTNSLHRLNMLAEDMTKAFQTMRERSQMFAMQKYTLLFGAILIPLIMKMTISLLGSIGNMLEDGGMGGGLMAGLGIAGGGNVIDSAASVGSGIPGGDGIAAMVVYALSIVPPYLVIYAMIASAAIADAEGKRSSAAMYFLGMCAISLIIFHFIVL